MNSQPDSDESENEPVKVKSGVAEPTDLAIAKYRTVGNFDSYFMASSDWQLYQVPAMFAAGSILQIEYRPLLPALWVAPAGASRADRHSDSCFAAAFGVILSTRTYSAWLFAPSQRVPSASSTVAPKQRQRRSVPG